MFCLLVRRLGILQFNSWLSAFSLLERPLLVDAVVQYLLYNIIGADLLGFWLGTEFFTIFLAPKFIKDSVPFVKDSVPFIKNSVPFIKDSVPFIKKSVPFIKKLGAKEIYVSVNLYRLVIFILYTAFTFEAETYVLQSDFVPESWPISCRYPFLDQSDHR